jgi:outer membrane protein OmpA-like peptidoglycan-associated protein
MNFYRLLAAGLLAALLAACSTPKLGTRVILLPQADGKPSAVVVSAKGGQETLARPYQRATALSGATGAPTVDAADPDKIRAENGALFELAPPAPLRFTVYFETGGTVLTRESQQTMTEALAAALARSGGELLVTGHTDTTGSTAQNDTLSRQRAQQVRQLFVDRNFPVQRTEAIGRGKRELAVPTADNVNEPRNRRVTIEVR